MKLNIDASDLLRFTRVAEKIERENKTAIARALNSVGNGVVRELTFKMAKSHGVSPERVASLITTQQASANRHLFRISVKSGLPEAGTELPRRHDEFEEGQLVIVVTAGDDKVCQVCQDIAENSPYTIEQARALIPHGGPLGDHECRCAIQPYVSRRRMIVEHQGGVEASMTMKQLADYVRNELQMTLRVH